MIDGVAWLQARATDVPADDDWLTGDERAVLAGLAVAKRRADWRLGRWTAKALLARVLGAPPTMVTVAAADDGAPEAFVDGTATGLSLSISHRDAVAVAAVAALPTRVGIDLETLEPRTDAFVREWLADDEQAALPARGAARDLAVLGCWTGKEASAKALREGLRLDVRHAVVTADPVADVVGSLAADWIADDSPSDGAGWSPLRVTWRTERVEHRGWWRHDDRTVVAVVADPPAGPPVVA